MKKIVILFILFSIFIYSKILVAVSIPPQEFILDKIASNLVDKITIVKPGNSPHLYEPKPSQMEKLSKAKLYFAIGVEFEKVWLNKFKSLNPNLKIIHSDSNITKYPIVNGQKKGKLDPHIWLDPINLKIIATNMTKALIKEDQVNSKIYESNLNKFLKELDILDKDIRNKLSKLKNRTFLVFHPSWGYYSKRYNLKQIAIEIGGKNPKSKELIKIIKIAKKNNIKVIIAQPEFSTKSANIIANEIDGIVIKVSPISKNVVKNIEKITNVIYKFNRID